MYKYNNDEDPILVVIVVVDRRNIGAGGTMMAWGLCQLQLVYYLSHVVRYGLRAA